MIVINSKSPTDAWVKSHEYLLENGNKDVMNESINMSVEIEDNFDISFKSETPLIKEARINGIAINFKELIKIVPNGLIQFEIKTPPPFTVLIIKPKRTPSAIPIKIFQCNDIFFIIFLNY